jgi:hypothetical protein
MPSRDSTPGPGGGPSPRHEQMRARAIGAARREAMRRRAVRIRKSVAAAATALFVAAFLGVYVQLASGHDPALNAAGKHSATTSISTGATSSAKSAESAESSGSGESSSASSGEASASESGGGEASSSSSPSSSEAESTSPSSVTTSQS